MIDKLLQTDSVYRCFCTPKRLELLRREAAKNRETIKYDNRCRHLSNEEIKRNILENKPNTIRLKLKPGPLEVNDIVYGKITYDLSKIEGDPILFKSDGMPTYHFANVVDDHCMSITHVLRGAEWLVSTPKHLMLYEAFGWPTPCYAHLPLIVNKDGTKLSKRHDHIRIDTYRKQGYYPQTILNYLTQMGGGFGQLDTVKSDTIYSLENLVETFSLSNVNQNNCRIDTDKVQLLNRSCIKQKCENNIHELVQEVVTLLRNETLGEDQEYIRNIILCNLVCFPISFVLKFILFCFQDRINTINDLLGPQFQYFWAEPQFNWDINQISSKKTSSKLKKS